MAAGRKAPGRAGCRCCRCRTGPAGSTFPGAGGRRSPDKHRSLPSPAAKGGGTGESRPGAATPAAMCGRPRSRPPAGHPPVTGSHTHRAGVPSRPVPPSPQHPGAVSGAGRAGGGGRAAPRPSAMTRPHSCLKSGGAPRGPSDRERRRRRHSAAEHDTFFPFFYTAGFFKVNFFIIIIFFTPTFIYSGLCFR